MKGIHTKSNKVRTKKGKVYDQQKYYIRVRKQGKKRKLIGIEVDKKVNSDNLGLI